MRPPADVTLRDRHPGDVCGMDPQTDAGHSIGCEAEGTRSSAVGWLITV